MRARRLIDNYLRGIAALPHLESDDTYGSATGFEPVGSLHPDLVTTDDPQLESYPSRPGG